MATRGASVAAGALAARIVRTLRQAGHTAYLAGGCVRDLLLDLPVKDFDVATSAPPKAVLSMFPAAGLVGAHFGVVLVRESGAAVEVATFRRDHAYRDGRHPDGVTFESDPRQDALRRDFTINAMMMDPDTGAILDFTGGRADLESRLVRAVGNPLDRFAEDHLRMLRAVRFAARLGFAIAPATFEAIQACAPRLLSISAERIREELERICTEGPVRSGVELLDRSGLLGEVLPEVARPVSAGRLESLAALESGPSGAAERVTLTLAVLLEHAAAEPGVPMNRLRFSAAHTRRVRELLREAGTIRALPGLSVAEQKRWLRREGRAEHLEFERIRHSAADPELYHWLRDRAAAWPPAALDPPRLATGDDLAAMGVDPGPRMARLLEDLETEQLEDRVVTREAALAWLRRRASGAVH